MNSPTSENPSTPPDPAGTSVPWSHADTWIGLGLLVIILFASALAVSIFKRPPIYGSIIVVFFELVYLLPAVIILSVRRANWKLLGFRKFDVNSLNLGCGLVVASYFITFINNYVFHLLGQKLQSDMLIRLIGSLHSPYWLVFTAVIVAPVVEESFFRGFLFAGFRQSYGWKRAALLSSLFFALAHMELAVLVPTFLLGTIFSYLYHRSNSIWPGIILHFLVNAFGVIAILVSLHSGLLTPP